MRQPQRWYPCRRVFAISLLASVLACTSWRTQGPTPEAAISARQPRVARVTRTDRSRITLHHPVVRGDTLLGQLSPGGARQDTAASVRVALRDIEAVAVPRFNVWKSVGLYFLVNIVVAAAVCLGGAECLEWQ